MEARARGGDTWARATATVITVGDDGFGVRYDDGVVERRLRRRSVRKYATIADALRLDRLRSLSGSLLWISMVMHGGRARLCSINELKAVIEKQLRSGKVSLSLIHI